MKHVRLLGIGILLCSAVLLLGCKKDEAKAPAKNGDKPKETAGSGEPKVPAKKGEAQSDHDHGDGPHGGAIFDFGKWHGEFTVNHERKEATVYILGNDAKKSAPIKADKLELTIDEPKFSVELKAAPMDGEEKGMSSRFVGTHDNLGKVQEFAGTLTGDVDGKQRKGSFKEEPPKKDKK